MGRRLFLGGSVAAAAVSVAGAASAQQATFKLDRLEIPGAPNDGLAIFRPVTQEKPILFGQISLGYSLNPLRMSNITTDRTTLTLSRAAVISNQLTTYGTVGFEFLNRVTVAATLPVTIVEVGNQPVNPPAAFGAPKTTAFSTSGPAAGDLRLDGRLVVLRTDEKINGFAKGSLGVQLSVFAPTGSTGNFGGDGQVSAWLGVAGEYTIKFLTLVANTGVHFRPNNSVNDPPKGSGLGVADEWRWAVGAFIPFKNGKFRLGGTIFGQTGLESDTTVIGDTVFTKQNTPIEWQAEGRMKFSLTGGAEEHWWVGAGAGTRILNGYGAPDLRILATIGAYVPILDSDANSPDRKLAMKRDIHKTLSDRDHDGIPDEIDPCPDEPEDHLDPDPTDGCPAPKDRDGDGIPDSQDACPDVKGKPSSDPKKNGCPEDPDRDHDGIPNAVDACPDVPGKPNTDPKKNGCPEGIVVEGTTVRTLKEIHFASGSAVLLPDSFPVLQEVVDLLKARPGIKKLRVEGHTDNQGGAAYNLGLSESRAASVRVWLTTHGIDAGRLESKGYGLTQPIDTNDTDAGRAKNRRSEFKILQEDNAPL